MPAASRARPEPAAPVPSASLFSWPVESGKFRLLAGILLAVSAAYGAAFLCLAIARGWPAGFGDSFALWSWGRFLSEHPAAQIYNPATLRAAQLGLGMDPGGSYPFAYPPTYLPVLWGLGRLPGPLSWLLLMGLTLPLYLWATLGDRVSGGALLTAIAAPTTTAALVSGQGGFLTAALLAGGVRLAGSHPVASGILFGLLSYKPQLGLLVPVALVAARLWRVIFTAAATGVVLIALTVLLYGPEIWEAWLGAVPGFSRQVAAEGGEIRHLMPTVFGALLQLGSGRGPAQIGQWAATLAAAAAVAGLYRGGPGRLAGAGLLAAALLATPYGFVYDMPIVATAVIWFVQERDQGGAALSTIEVAAVVFALLTPIVLAAGTSAFPAGPVSLASLLGVIVSRHRRA